MSEREHPSSPTGWRAANRMVMLKFVYPKIPIKWDRICMGTALTMCLPNDWLKRLTRFLNEQYE